MGAGLAVGVDHATHHAKVGAVGAGAAVAIPVAIYLLCLWMLHYRPEYRRARLATPLAATLVLLTAFTSHTVLLTGVILAALVATKSVILRRPDRGQSL